jgi:hypothetical protein
VDDVKGTYKDGILDVRAPLANSPSSTSKVPINKGESRTKASPTNARDVHRERRQGY